MGTPAHTSLSLLLLRGQWVSCAEALRVSSQETLLLEWVNPMYLDISYQEQIQEEFEESAEIQLKDFLKVSLLLLLRQGRLYSLFFSSSPC